MISVLNIDHLVTSVSNCVDNKLQEEYTSNQPSQSKHEQLTHWLANVDPLYTTLAQQWLNVSVVEL